jgi:hypothetical protein
MTSPLPEQIELHRDRMCAATKTSALNQLTPNVSSKTWALQIRWQMPVALVHRFDIAVCGRRDVSLPAAFRRKQKDEETRLTWYLKDEVMRRGRVYYAKLAGGRSMFVAPALISHFAAVFIFKSQPIISPSEKLQASASRQIDALRLDAHTAAPSECASVRASLRA